MRRGCLVPHRNVIEVDVASKTGKRSLSGFLSFLTSARLVFSRLVRLKSQVGRGNTHIAESHRCVVNRQPVSASALAF